MKYLLIIATLFYSSSYAQNIIVLSKNEKCYLDSINIKCKVDQNYKLEFINNFKNEKLKDSLNTKRAKLITPPLEWGKKVSDTTYGEIAYCNSFPSGFITDLSLFNLLPEHTYLLTLNGNPKLAGNNLLPDTVPNYNIEKYYDFLSIKTDIYGNYHARIGVYLKPSEYNARFYVKDTNGFKIVLYHDYFKFDVR